MKPRNSNPAEAKGPPPLAPDRASHDDASFSRAVRAMFGSLAPRYDSFNRWASLGLDRGWRRAALRSLQLTPRSVVLDVATGTGDLAFAASRLARVAIGCDFADEMIRAARQKAERNDRRRPAGEAVFRPSPPSGDTDVVLRHVRSGTAAATGSVFFQVARAEALPYVSESFDGVTSAFAMRNVRPMLNDVLREALRVLRSGGRLAILEFSRPPLAPVRWTHAVYIRRLMPRIGELVTGTREPFEYLYRSIEEWKTPGEFAELLRAAGFADVACRLLGLGTVALHTGTKP